MTKRGEPEGFREFWEDVWRKNARHTDGRGLARETFARHVRAGADPEDIILGAKWFFSTMKERDREFVPLSSTWINREAYTDLAEAYRAHEARKAERTRNTDNVVTIPTISPERRQEMAARARELVKGHG